MRFNRASAAVFGIVVLALIRIALTFCVFSETADESTHVAVGLHIWTQHRLGIQFENPPLVPIVLALPPLLAGVEFRSGTDFVTMTGSVFHSLPGYCTSLFMARVGNLLFFAIASLSVWGWARQLIGRRGGLIALVLFTMEPILLGYSGLATHDAGAVAGVAVAMLAFARWLDRRSWRRALEFGAAFGFAVLCKFSCLLFVPAACIAVMAVRVFCQRDFANQWRSWTTLLAVPVTAGLAVWGGYGFSAAPVSDIHIRGSIAGSIISRWPEALPVPAPGFFQGLHGIERINRTGMSSFALGRTTTQGWWWYFPLAIVLKSTIPFLLLIAIGFHAARGDLRGPFLEAFAAGAAMLLPAMASTLNLGVRYVLAVHVAWAVAAAATVVALFENRRRLARIVAALLMAAQIAISALAHPDYFPYFNMLAGPDPSRALIDSNLDWGQDALRLRAVVRQRQISTLGAMLFASPNLDQLGFPPRFEVTSRTSGYIAVSDHVYRVSVAGGRHWLAGRPYQRVGKSIRLYYVP